MKDNKKIIVVGIVIWFLALIVTFVIAKDNTKNIKENNNNEEKVEKEENNKVVYKGATLYDTYDENDIVITDKIVSEEEKYIVISGLKDKEIEKKVNDKIYNLYSETDKKMIGCDSKSNTIDLEANFGDIISVYNYGSCEKNGEIDFVYDALTINLNDGEEIKFDELFTTDEIVSSLLAENMSYYIARYYEFNKDIPDSALYNYKESDIEDLIYMSVQEIRNDKNTYFYVNNEKISIDWRGVNASIYVVDNLDNIAFFTRFKNKESIYSDDKVGKEKRYLALPATYFNYGESRFEEIDDNILIDYKYVNYDMTNEEFNSFLDKLKVPTNLENKIKTAPKDKFTYINNISEIGKAENYELYFPHIISTQVCTMSKDLYNNSIREYIFRKKTSDDRVAVEHNNIVYFKDKNVKCEFIEDFVGGYYNKDGIEIKSIEDIFKDGYDYQSIINDEIKKEAIKQLEIEEDSINIEVLELETDFSSQYIFVRATCDITDTETSMSYGRYIIISIPYTKFERSKMTI